MALIRFKRGTRAQIDAAAGSNGLHAGEPYLFTDEGVVAVGTGVDGYVNTVSSQDITKIVPLTQAAYDQLDPPNPTTLYLILEP